MFSLFTKPFSKCYIYRNLHFTLIHLRCFTIKQNLPVDKDHLIILTLLISLTFTRNKLEGTME